MVDKKKPKYVKPKIERIPTSPLGEKRPRHELTKDMIAIYKQREKERELAEMCDAQDNTIVTVTDRAYLYSYIVIGNYSFLSFN